jgi:nucleoside-diphosphate-sugar epimerase
LNHSIVTGGAGFVGSHLCEFLLKRGHRVTCVDNLITGRLENVASLRGNRRFRFVRHDVTRPLPGRVTRARYLFHLASPASPVGYQQNPIATIRANSTGTHLLLEWCRRNRCRFLFASTSEVYGNPTVHPQVETYWGNVNSFGPRSCYDESKRLGEALVYEYVHRFGVDARLVRIFNTYGPRLNETDGRVVSNFVNQALRGKPLTVYGRGLQTRSFCYVSDLVAGLWAAMTRPGTRGDVFNLGNPNETTILQFARTVQRLCGRAGARIVHKPMPQDDPVKRKPDISKAGRVLGWRPRVSLSEGLAHTIAYYKARM